MRKSYNVWNHPEACEDGIGARVDSKVRAKINTVQGAKSVFCAVTGWQAKDLEDDTTTWDYEQVEFYHKEYGCIGGIGL